MSFVHLFRCKAEKYAQGDAFAEQMTAVEVLTNSFLARPTAKVPRGAIWHIGNTQLRDEGVVFFALGRESIVTAHAFDDERKEFQEIEQLQAPFTVGVFDPKTQVIGVLMKPGVSLGAREVGSKLAALLEEAGVASRANRHITVDFIPDPTGFIASLEAAYRVTRFEFEFTTPNPPDDDKYIQRPLKRFAERVGAEQGKTSVRGSALDKAELIDLTRNVAATGDNATANVQMVAGGEIERKNLNVNALREQVDAGAHEDAADAILRSIRKAYDALREGPVNE